MEALCNGIRFTAGKIFAYTADLEPETVKLEG